eukprot:763937-Hanusia_phi.AAC.4
MNRDQGSGLRLELRRKVLCFPLALGSSRGEYRSKGATRRITESEEREARSNEHGRLQKRIGDLREERRGDQEEGRSMHEGERAAQDQAHELRDSGERRGREGEQETTPTLQGLLPSPPM